VCGAFVIVVHFEFWRNVFFEYEYFVSQGKRGPHQRIGALYRKYLRRLRHTLIGLSSFDVFRNLPQPDRNFSHDSHKSNVLDVIPSNVRPRCNSYLSEDLQHVAVRIAKENRAMAEWVIRHR
jgi:hypothetical protein